MTKIIGGKLDGHESPVRCVTLQEKDETYMLMSFKEGDTKHFFYMLTGSDLTPAEALKTYKVREGLAKVQAAKDAAK